MHPVHLALSGDLGFPVVGETFAFLDNPIEFSKEKSNKHGCPFLTRIIAQKIAMCTRRQSADDLLAKSDGSTFSLADGYSILLEKPYGDICLLRDFKGGSEEMLLTYLPMFRNALSSSAIDGYVQSALPVIEKRVKSWLEDEIAVYPKLKMLFSEVLGTIMLGLSAEESVELEKLTRISFNGATSVPLNISIPLLFSSKFSQMQSANAKILALIKR
eukprot:13739_1